VWQARRALGRRDALFADLDAASQGSARPEAPEIRALLAGLPCGGWAMHGATIDRLVAVVNTKRPRFVAEFGSGTSTLAVAHVLAHLHGDETRLVSFDQDLRWMRHTRERLDERGLTDVVQLVHLPLGPGPGGSPVRCYEMTDEGRAALTAHPPELVVVDGPSLISGASRLGVVDLVAPFLASTATILLDDAFRDAELCVAERWRARDDVELLGVWLIGLGLVEAKLAPAPTTRRVIDADAAAPPATPARAAAGGVRPARSRGSRAAR
jgi:hypothetical protein